MRGRLQVYKGSRQGRVTGYGKRKGTGCSENSDKRHHQLCRTNLKGTAASPTKTRQPGKPAFVNRKKQKTRQNPYNYAQPTRAVTVKPIPKEKPKNTGPAAVVSDSGPQGPKENMKQTINTPLNRPTSLQKTQQPACLPQANKTYVTRGGMHTSALKATGNATRPFSANVDHIRVFYCADSSLWPNRGGVTSYNLATENMHQPVANAA